MKQIRIGKILLTDGGEWNATKGYPILSYVRHNGDGWWSVKANVNSEPSSSNVNWIQATNVQAFIQQLQQATQSAQDINAAIQAAEQIRSTAEAARVQAENARVSVEASRVSAEQARVAAENARVQAENARVSAEQSRVQAEQARVQAEASRANTFAAKVTESETATALATQKASAAQTAATNADTKAALANSAAENANAAAASASAIANSKVDKVEGKELMDSDLAENIRMSDGLVNIWDTALKCENDIYANYVDIDGDLDCENITMSGELTDKNGHLPLVDIARDFGKYAYLPSKTLTPSQSGKRINSAGEFVTDANWSIASIGAVVVGNTYELKMGDSSKMVLGTALFVSHTQEQVGTQMKDVYTPLFSAMSTDIPASGYVCFEAMEAYDEVLVCYRNDVSGANTLLVRRYGTKASIATQINNLKKKVDLKSFADGYYAGMSVGTADNLTPRGEASAEVISERVAGGTNSIEDGNATIKTINGKTIKWGNFCKDVYKNAITGTLTSTDTTNTISSSGSTAYFVYKSSGNEIVNGHKYIISFDIVSAQGKRIRVGIGNSVDKPVTTSQKCAILNYVSGQYENKTYIVQFIAQGGDGVSITLRNNVGIIDLTACGLDSCTTADQVAAVWGYSTWDAFAASPEFADLMEYSETPRLISCKPKAIKTTGRNLWDEQWENANFTEDGEKYSSPYSLASKNYIKVITNTTYYWLGGSLKNSVFVYFDSNYKFISKSVVYDKRTFAVPENAHFAKFVSSYVATYDYTSCLNISDTSFNGQYAPYEEHTRDLEWTKQYFPDGMRSIPSECDEVTARKASHKIGVKVFDGTESWSTQTLGDSPCFYLIINEKSAYSGVMAEYVSNDYPSADSKRWFSSTRGGNNAFWISKDEFSTLEEWKEHLASRYAAGNPIVLYYKLATPIETEYDEKNLAYQVTKGGMEVFEHQSGESAPLNADVIYGIDSYDTIKANKAHIGTIGNLATASKTDLVAAINELVSRISALETTTTQEGGNA